MSWHANRYRLEVVAPRKANQLDSMSKHHVPPRHPARAAPFLLRKSVTDHRAYHQLFRNAGSYEQCCEILRREWWTHPALQGEE